MRILRYQIELKHVDLLLHKVVTATEILILQNKVDTLLADWDRKYELFLTKSNHQANAFSADQSTAEAMDKFHALELILIDGLANATAINWDEIKDHSQYVGNFRALPKPMIKLAPEAPSYIAPTITFWDKLTGKKASKLEAAIQDFKQRAEMWKRGNALREEAYNAALSEWRERTQEDIAAHKKAEHEFYASQFEANAKIDKLRDAVISGDEDGVLELVALVLDRSDYGDLFEKEYQLRYSRADRLLLVEYRLPSPDIMPTIKNVRYVKSTGELKHSCISEREQQQNFDRACYQVCLRTLHEIFTADKDGNVENVAFNGIINYIDKTTGHDAEACIMSIIVDRRQFEVIDLERIDPKACFKSLKGVSASSLASVAPVAPLIRLNRNDKRFIEAKDAIGGLNEATNLASMDWEEFEHLVRGLFEKEFAARGGEVKITQSSSDGGVDAVAFDPDPITGGKIVIQAKRYTKTVGVSAIRDLYGTMQHEAASRGILVTTADFGPDAHKFASGKPITLLTGANLLHMLERHGINARINIREARKQLNLRDLGR